MDDRAHRGVFTRAGGAVLALLAGMLATQMAVLILAARFSPALMAEPVFRGILALVSCYGVGFLLFWLVIRTTPDAAAPEDRRPLSPGRFVQVYLIAMAALYLSNYVTLALTALIGRLRDMPVSNPVNSLSDYPLALSLILSCAAAPVAEELMFRRLLLRRLLPYGERFAVVASALCFALFHGTLNQLLYAFVLGLIFGYMAVRTGSLWQVMLLHALVNFIFSGLVPLLSPLGRAGSFALNLLVLAFLAGGILCFCLRVRAVHLRRGGYPIPEPRKWALFFSNPGVLGLCALAALLIVQNLG